LWFGTFGTILVGLALFGFSIVALRSFHLLIDAGYALFASILCATVLPLVRIAHESGSFQPERLDYKTVTRPMLGTNK
jgi:hypothetical protein